MEIPDSDITRWSATWWGEKLDRLKKMIVAEVRDEIGNYKNTGSLFGGAQYVRYYVDGIIREDRVREEFISSNVNIEDASTHGKENQPHKDRTLIVDLYNQLPHADQRWTAAVQKVSSSSSLNPVGIKVDTADTFHTIISLVKYVQQVCEAVTGAKLQDQVQRLLQSERMFLSQQQQANHRAREVEEQQTRLAAEFQAAIAQIQQRDNNGNRTITSDTIARTSTRRGASGVNTAGESLYPFQHGGGTQLSGGLQFRDNNNSSYPSCDAPTRVQSSRQGMSGVNTISELLYVPPRGFDYLYGHQEESEDDEGEAGAQVFDMFLVNSATYMRSLHASIGNAIERLGLNKSSMDLLYPSVIQTHARKHAAAENPPFQLASVASLVRYARKVPDQAVSKEFMDLICHAVQSVVHQIGGTSIVTERDIGGCDRRIGTRIHVCKGSHSAKTCPQALQYPSTGVVMHPSLQEVCQLTSPEQLMARCREIATDKHTAECRGKEGRFAGCKACVEYMHQLVYPKMYEKVTALLDDSSSSEADKQEYRVYLAAGLLTAVWGLRGL
jgi:hypothetical protein